MPPDDDPHCADNTIELVRESGWSSTGVRESGGVPGWAYSIGLWHTLGSAEVAMFGLGLSDMQHWVNALAEQIRGGRPVVLDDNPRHGILPDGFPVLLRPVHHSWHPSLFGAALRFYGRPPLPMVQIVWPDRHGYYPWEPEASSGCRINQPRLWLPRDEHPASFWRDLEVITPWPFEDSGILTRVITTGRIMDGVEPVRGAARGEEGDWQFLDGGEVTEEDARVVHLYHLYARHPQIVGAAGLQPGRQAWLDEENRWRESALDG